MPAGRLSASGVWGVIAAWLVGVPSASGQGAITLRPVARVAEAAPVTLADVAVLEGPDAAGLAGTVILRADERQQERGELAVDADRVRRAIDAASGPRGVNWGRVTISGGRCAILPAIAAARPVAAAPPTEPVPGPTVRVVVEERLRQLLGVEAADLRLVFDEADREILGAATDGRTVDVRPGGSSARMPLAIAVYDSASGRLVLSRTVRVGVEVRRDVAVARAAKQRGELIAEADVTAESRWVPPSDACPGIDRVIGAAARSRLAPGQVIGASDIEPPVIVRKGELVSVHSVNGLVIIRLTARALAAARDGEVVRLQSLADDKRTFYARMDGRGRAVALNHAAPEQESSR